MNKYLVNFIDDELQHNNYYKSIRRFAEGKYWNRDILSPVVNEYEDHIDDFGPYKFLDAIEDFLSNEDSDAKVVEAKDLQEVIDLMWEIDYFEQY